MGNGGHLFRLTASILVDGRCPMEYKKVVQTVVETPTYLAIANFPKKQKENLSMAERNTLRKRAHSIFETYGS
jgi:hypothetical protein